MKITVEDTSPAAAIRQIRVVDESPQDTIVHVLPVNEVAPPRIVAVNIGTQGPAGPTGPTGPAADITTFVQVLDYLLENAPSSEDSEYSAVYQSGLLTSESWSRASDSTLWKSIDYTYLSRLLSTEVVKVFDATGLVIEAQLTKSYAYTGAVLSSVTITRDV